MRWKNHISSVLWQYDFFHFEFYIPESYIFQFIWPIGYWSKSRTIYAIFAKVHQTDENLFKFTFSRGFSKRYCLKFLYSSFQCSLLDESRVMWPICRKCIPTILALLNTIIYICCSFGELWVYALRMFSSVSKFRHDMPCRAVKLPCTSNLIGWKLISRAVVGSKDVVNFIPCRAVYHTNVLQ